MKEQTSEERERGGGGGDRRGASSGPLSILWWLARAGDRPPCRQSGSPLPAQAQPV